MWVVVLKIFTGKMQNTANNIIISSPHIDWLSCRQVLNIMVIIGFMMNYALRVNLTIAIVAMVPTPSAIVAINATINATDALALIAGNVTTATPPALLGDERFNWDAMQQNMIHGSFFWGYILTEIPGGRLAELIGGRRVFGHSMLWASVLTLLTPGAAYLDYKVVVFLRALLGLMLGASWPAIHPMTAVWIKPLDRSKFMANMMASALGAAIAMPVFGFLIEYLGWESVFYVSGGIGLLWSVLWFVFIFESPAAHPRISAEERQEIEDAIGTSTSKKRPSYVPWLSILSSPCVWAIIIVHGCSVFGYFTVVNQLPTYMKTILHYNIKEVSTMSRVPSFRVVFHHVRQVFVFIGYTEQTSDRATCAKLLCQYCICTQIDCLRQLVKHTRNNSYANFQGFKHHCVYG